MKSFSLTPSKWLTEQWLMWLFSVTWSVVQWRVRFHCMHRPYVIMEVRVCVILNCGCLPSIVSWKGMSRGASSCSCNSWVHRTCNSCHGGSRVLVSPPICDCGGIAVVRTTRTTKNLGKQFWGCANFKVCFLVFHFHLVLLFCRDVVKMFWAITFSNGVTKRVLMSEMLLSLGKGRRSLIWKIHWVFGRNRCNCH